MKTIINLAFTLGIAATVCVTSTWILRSVDPVNSDHRGLVQSESPDTVADPDIIRDDNIRLCQHGYTVAANQCGCAGGCDGSCVVTAGAVGLYQDPGPGRGLLGVDGTTPRLGNLEPRFRRGSQVPFEQFGYGEWVGPHRTPQLPEYRLRVGDQVEFVYIRTREKSLFPYQIYVGDTIEVTSATDATLSQTDLLIRSDGKTTFNQIGQVLCAGKTVDDLQRELNDRYSEFIREPNLVVQVITSDTPLNDIIDSVDARQGQGGQSRLASVAPDGTVQLPAIGSIPAVGLTLSEIGREVNARYRRRLGGIEITPVLLEVSPRFVYVLGEVDTPGRFELTGPTTALQALALAQGDEDGGNLRQVIVFRRDQNWQLTATKLDLAGAIYGKRPLPSDDIWIRDSDIVLVPPRPIQRLSEAVNLYLTNTLFSIFPQQGVAFSFDDFTTF